VDVTYDIFRGVPDGGPIWIETVQGLDNARAKLRKLFEARPDDYFVYDSTTSNVVATTV
jgi:hypothetical protein